MTCELLLVQYEEEEGMFEICGPYYVVDKRLQIQIINRLMEIGDITFDDLEEGKDNPDFEDIEE